MTVSPKKHLGQHFLRDENIAKKIVSSLSKENYSTIVEVGPGTGVLTKYLLQEKGMEVFAIEVDRESISFLKKSFPELQDRLIAKDFLTLDFDSPPFGESWSGAVIGNFPYNISSQIL